MWRDNERRPVSREQFALDGFDELSERIARVADDAGYVVVWDRTERETKNKLGRFDVSEENAWKYLDEPEVLDHDFGEPVLPEGGMGDAIIRWLQGLALGSMDGRDLGRFRVRVYGPKASAILDTASFSCRRLQEPTAPPGRPTLVDVIDGKPVWARPRRTAPDTNIPLVPVPSEWRPGRSFRHRSTFGGLVRQGTTAVRIFTDRRRPTSAARPSFPGSPLLAHDSSAIGSTTMVSWNRNEWDIDRSVQALGKLYERYAELVLGTMDRMQGIHTSMHGQLHDQLQASRAQVDTLVASILEARTNELEVAQDHQLAERADDARTALIREAITQISQAAQVMASGKGLPPELAEVVSLIAASPELMGTLTDPAVRALMRNPANLNGLAQMLKAAAAQPSPAPAPPPPQPAD